MPRGCNLITAWLLSAACATVQRSTPVVVHDPVVYQRQVSRDHELELVDLATFAPGIYFDVRYAGTDNFMHEKLYPVAAVFVRRPVAAALAQVQRELATEHLSLLVFDGYRPFRVTERMWEKIHNPDFVADPALGSRHNRGAAVDLTLCDAATGSPVPMPTPFDDFTIKARSDYIALPAAVLADRERLRRVMTHYGFTELPSEWWHFDYQGWQRFPLLDISLDWLQKNASR